VDSLRASGADDHAALDRVLAVAGRRGGVPVVRLVGAFLDSASAGLWLPDGVRVEGPATIRFTSPDLALGAVNMAHDNTVVDLTITGPWERQDYDPRGRKHPGFNSGGGPDHHASNIELRRVHARGFAGAGFNSGAYVDDLRVYNSEFSDNGDAGVQIGLEVRGFALEGIRATGNRNNGFDINGSGGSVTHDTATGNGRAATLYPDGSSDLNGFLVWAVGTPAERHDAAGNVLADNMATGTAARGFSVVGGGFAAVRATTLRNNVASGNGSAAFHLQGNANLDGLGDLQGTTLTGNTGEWLYVQHFGPGTGRFIAGLRLCANSLARIDVDSHEDEVVTLPAPCP
jgi:hypothetical protein